VGKVVQPLQSVNYHDSHAHSHEWHGPFTRLVGGMVGMVLVGFNWV
jgi:Leu/Phe-tRNA-protein transferase